MTVPDLDLIGARADEATEGPWVWDAPGRSERTLRGKSRNAIFFPRVRQGDAIADLVNREPDAEFIAHARTDIPLLLDALVLERERAEAWRQAFGVEPLTDPEVASAFVESLAEAASIAEAEVVLVRERVKELEEALRPWIEQAEKDGLFEGAWAEDIDDEWTQPPYITLGQLRAIRAALSVFSEPTT